VRRNARDDQKVSRLCRQVREALSLALADVEDDAILELSVIDVVPAPDVTRLAVSIHAPEGSDIHALHEKLERVMGRLRSDVANAIHRKKTPSLVFVFVADSSPV